MKFFSTSLFILVTLASSCAPTIKNFDIYQKQFLSQTAFMPSKENLQGAAPKVVVFALDESDNTLAVQAGLGKSVASDVETILSNNHLGEIVDRNAAEKLQKEIALSEMKGTGSYKGPIVADYAISGVISNAGFTSKYSAGFFYPHPKTGQIITIPPSYHYSTDIAGHLKIYELPSLQVIQTIAFNDKQSRKENVQQDGGFAWGGLQVGGKKVQGKTSDDNLLRKTAKNAIETVEIDIKNFFSKKGYILEKRVYKKKTIFKISLGSLDGIKQGDQFEITGQYESENPITKEIETEKRIIAQGVVTDIIHPNTAWVMLKDAKKVNAIRLGDSLKIKYRRTIFDKISQFTHRFLN